MGPCCSILIRVNYNLRFELGLQKSCIDGVTRDITTAILKLLACEKPVKTLSRLNIESTTAMHGREKERRSSHL